MGEGFSGSIIFTNLEEGVALNHTLVCFSGSVCIEIQAGVETGWRGAGRDKDGCRQGGPGIEPCCYMQPPPPPSPFSSFSASSFSLHLHLLFLNHHLSPIILSPPPPLILPLLFLLLPQLLPRPSSATSTSSSTTTIPTLPFPPPLAPPPPAPLPLPAPPPQPPPFPLFLLLLLLPLFLPRKEEPVVYSMCNWVNYWPYRVLSYRCENEVWGLCVINYQQVC